MPEPPRRMTEEKETMMKMKRKGMRMRPLSLTMVLMAMLFGLALFVPGGDAYAQQQEQQVEPPKPVVQVVKQDQDGNPVKGAKMELWRIQIPRENFLASGTVDYDTLLEALKGPNEKFVGKVDEWVTDGTPHSIDLSKYFPESYDCGLEPHMFFDWDPRYNYYSEGKYPFCYMLIETDTPGGYMTAEKKFFRVDPLVDSFNGIGRVYNIDIEYYNSDPRKNRASTTDVQQLTEPIIAVDTMAPLLIDKLDQNGNHLKGAELELLDESGETVIDTDGNPVKWTSSGGTDELWIKRPSFPDADATGHGGGPVNYTIHEISAPEGYDKGNDVTFTLYPCGKWDYAEGSEPSIGHESSQSSQSSEEQLGGGNGPSSDIPIPPTPCDQQGPVPTPGCVLEPLNPTVASTIPYVHTDPVRIINPKSTSSNDETVNTASTDVVGDAAVKTASVDAPETDDEPESTEVKSASSGGSSSTTSSSSGGSSKTGDSGSPMIVLLLLAAAALGGGTVFVRRRMAR